jgi:uncharacterized protein (TIGR00290 family)
MGIFGEKTQVVMSWSGGKDSCLALHEIQRAGNFEVAALITTVTQDYDRISMHGVRRVLLEAQAASLGLPLRQVTITKGASNSEYERELTAVLAEFGERGIDTVVFGDLFLADIRAYREQFLARLGMRGCFPVWQRDTTSFIREFIQLGFKAYITCVDSRILDQSFAGRLIDEDLIESLPEPVDPCGENGEFHSFVFDGPNFTGEVSCRPGEIVLRDSFWFCDLVPK